MLSGVLLHVVAAAEAVDFGVDVRAGLERGLVEVALGFEVVDDASVFGVGDFGDFELRVSRCDGAGVVDLASAGGIEGRAVEDERRARGVNDVTDFGVEVVEEGVVVVEAVGHGCTYLRGVTGAELQSESP